MKRILLLFLCGYILVSCKKENNEAPRITAETIAGRWDLVSYSNKVWFRGELLQDDHYEGIMRDEFEYIPKDTVIHRYYRGYERGTYTITYDSGKYYYESRMGIRGALNSGIGEIQMIGKDSFQLTFITVEGDSKTIYSPILKRK